MTRETKIGLLVGLAFIITFAVLLSHLTPPSPAGDGLSVVELQQENDGVTYDGVGAVRVNDPLAMAPSTEAPSSGDLVTPESAPKDPGRLAVSDPADSPSPTGRQRDRLPYSLPRVDALETQLVSRDTGGSHAPTGHESALSEESKLSEETHLVALVEVPRHRVAPPLPAPIAEPHPTPRPDPPVVSSVPEPEKKTPPAKPSLLKEYLVRVGDTLSTISEAQYGTSKPVVVDFLARFNQSRIKSKHELLAGQSLVIPELPADLFEKVDGFDATKIAAGARSVTLEELAKADQRRAPLPVKTSSARDAMRRVDAAANRNQKDAGTKAQIEPKRRPSVRWYEVKPNDTFTSIARQQLGSVGLWREIQKLNPKVDSSKMRPGDRIRLPNEPVPEAFKKLRGSV